jgi:MFS superfamily sulfate permease-like transporter
MSAIFHGILLLVLTVTIPHWLNLIPLACLASVLFVVGYKLAKPALFKSMFTKGWDQFLPFVITIIAILVSDLLKGIAVGMVVGKYLLRLQKDVSFLNKAILMRELGKVPDGANILIDVSRAQFIDADIQEVLNNFIASASDREIKLTLEGFKLASENE